MKLETVFSVLIPVLVLFLVGTAAVSAQMAAPSLPTPCRPVNHESVTTYENEDFDLDACERACRRDFGYEPFLADGYELYQDQPYWAYSKCIADCHKTFWKEFDRKTRNLPGGR